MNPAMIEIAMNYEGQVGVHTWISSFGDPAPSLEVIDYRTGGLPARVAIARHGDIAPSTGTTCL